MKNFTRLLLLFAFLCTFFRTEAQITIGTGTLTARYPINFWYQHGRHVAIYTAAEMNTVAAGATITTLTWTAVNATNGGSITIKLLECGTQTTIASLASYATQTAGATTVYTSASFTPTIGANLIDITDFAINPNQNLKVIVETDNDPANTPTCDGQGTSTSNTFNYTASTAGSGTYFDYDDSGTGPACAAGTIGSATQLSHRPNITIGGLTPPAAPDCATLNTPANGATGVVRNTPLTWTAASTGGTATAFKVYLGTVNPPTTLVSTITAPTATYTPTGQIYNTVYYWYIVPTGPGGDAVGCNATVNSYTTELAPPPPANDNICGAVSLSVSSGVTCTTLLTGQSTENATAGAAACTGTGADDDVWYSFVATSTSHIITLSTSGAGSTDRVHQLYSSSDNTCSGTLTSITCSDPETSTTTGLTIGNTYFLRVHSYATGNFATYAICITTPPPPPANDLICGAVSLSISSGITCTTSLTGQSTQYATAGAAACTGTGADDDVWYSFVATSTTHIITLTSSGAGSTDRVHQLYSSSNNTCSGTLTSLTCSDPETSTTSSLTIGNTYFLRVHSYSTGNFATYDICITTPPPPPANDECSNSVTLVPQPFTASGCPSATSGTTVAATISTTPTTAFWGTSNDDDVWYTFTTGAGVTSQIVRFCNVTFPSGAAVNMALELHASCSTSGIVGPTVTITSGAGETTLTGLTANTNYKLRVFTSSTSSRANFDISILNTPPVPDCATLNTPTNGATMVVTNTPLTWSAPATGGTPTGYKVYLGTVNPPTTLVSTVAAPTTTYTPTGQAPNTLYYWYIVPTNGTGDAVGCNATVFSYTTAPLTCPANLGAGTVNVASLPYNSGAGQTTCGNGNNITSTTASIVCGSSNYYGGEDKTYIFTPTTTASYTILVTTTTDQDAGITLYQGCPLVGQGGTCVGNAQSTSGLTRTIVANLTAGVTYYLVVDNFPSPACLTSYTVDIALSPSMTYTSSAITQQTGTAAAGTSYQKILQLAVVTANAANPLQVTQLDFTTAGNPGTSTPADLTNARVYYTSTTSTFTDGAPAGTQFGSTIVNPSGAMTFMGTQALTTGSNYFWLVYDLACGAVGPNIDASMVTNGLTMTGGPYTPTTPDPGSGRTVTALSSFTTAANGSWDAPSTWSCGTPPPTGTTTVIINHNVTVPSGSNVCGNLTIAAGRTLTINGGTLVVGTSSAGALTGNSNRVVTVNGTLTISSGQMDINGSMVAALAGFFNMSGGTLNIDPNDGTSAGSATGTTMSLLNGTNGSVTGGAINFLDPPFASSSRLIAFDHASQDATWATGCTVTIGGGDDTNISNTAGFYVECNVNTGTLEIGSMTVNGGRNNNGVTNVYRAMTTNASASFITKIRNLTVNSGSEVVVRGAPLVITGANLTNDGFITVISSTAHRGLVFAGDAQYNGSNVAFTNSSIQQTWSGSGFFKKATADADPSSSDQNAVTSLAFFNGGSSSALTTGSPLSCTNLHLGAGVLNTSSSAPIIVGTGSGTSGNITVAASAASAATTVTLPLAAAWAGGWVNGPVERWFKAAVTSTTEAILPTGSSSTHQIATISFSAAPTTAGKLRATFSSTAPEGGTVISPPLTQGVLSITSVSPSGEWLIEPTATSGVAGGTYAANLYANGFTKTNGVAAITLPAETVMLKRPSASIVASDWTLSGTHVTSATAGTGIIRLQRTGGTGFSKFAMGGTTAALPIELKSFTGKSLKTSNQLEWTTSTEEGVKEHIIERSANGYNNWTLVGTTPSKGDARVDQSYSMEDKTPLTKSFYRLRTLDLDGREQFSNVISLTRQNNSFGVIAAYPNPAVEMINVQFNTLEEGNITARIVDMTGRLVLEQQMSALKGTNMFPVQLHGLSAGTYFITLSSDNEVAEPIRFVKQ
jgi:hypothetical protein